MVEVLPLRKPLEDFGAAMEDPIAGKPFRTSPFLSKYERAVLIQKRAPQIAMGAPCRVPACGITDPIALAALEIGARKMPLFLIRRVQGARVSEIVNPNVLAYH